MLKSVLFTLIGMNFCLLLFTTIAEHREICVRSYKRKSMTEVHKEQNNK